MTAGSGILHQEMPRGDAQGRMHGFQLWANLPSSLKMTNPRYQDIPASAIPEVMDDDGTRVRVISGEFWGKRGPVEGVAADPNYLDISVPPRKQKRLTVETTRNAFAYVFAGSGTFRDASDPQGVLTESGTDPNAPARYDAGNHSLVLFDRGDEVVVRAGEEGGLPAGLGQADRGAGCLVRPDRDEHARAAGAGSHRAQERRLYQTPVKILFSQYPLEAGRREHEHHAEGVSPPVTSRRSAPRRSSLPQAESRAHSEPAPIRERYAGSSAGPGRCEDCRARDRRCRIRCIPRHPA
jgi:hypothetical protein